MPDVGRFRVFFNRPDRPAPLALLMDDVRRARQRLLVASAWFTDRELADAFIQSTAVIKIAVLNDADLRRDGTSRAVAGIFQGWAVTLAPTSDSGLAVLGGDRMHMHHKWVVADDVVWWGSYNLTFQARRNFETLSRLEHAQTADEFMTEAQVLLATARGQLAVEAIDRGRIVGYERCPRCNVLVPEAEMVWANRCLGQTGGGGVIDSSYPMHCERCAQQIDKLLPRWAERGGPWNIRDLCAGGCDGWHCLECGRCEHLFLWGGEDLRGDWSIGEGEPGCGDDECMEQHCAACHAWHSTPKAAYTQCPGCGGPIPHHVRGCRDGQGSLKCERCQLGRVCRDCESLLPSSLVNALREWTPDGRRRLEVHMAIGSRPLYFDHVHVSGPTLVGYTRPDYQNRRIPLEGIDDARLRD